METGVPPTRRYPIRCKLARGRHNSHSSLSQFQEPRVDDKAKDNVFVTCKRRRKEKQRHESIINLPREVLFDILLRLPANLLQEVMRYVCKQWYDIINDPFFIRAHWQMPTNTTTSASCIIQTHIKRHKVYCADEDGVITKIRLRLPFPVKIQGSCNGLVLFCDNWDTLKVYIMNPLRKLIVSLPRVVPVVLRGAYNISYSFAVNSSGQYKVVQLSLYKLPHRLEMSVFTIGVDKAWRHIDVEAHQGFFLNYLDMTQRLNTGGLFVAGFLYWGSRNSVSLAMDVDTETLYEFSCPMDLRSRIYDSHFINMGTALGLMGEVDDHKHGKWTLFRLTDVKSSEWTEIDTINIRAIIRKVSNGKRTYGSMYLHIKPVSLIGDELWFYTGVDLALTWMIRYNLADKSFMCFHIMVPCWHISCIHHVPTLASPRKMLRLTSSKHE